MLPVNELKKGTVISRKRDADGAPNAGIIPTSLLIQPASTTFLMAMVPPMYSMIDDEGHAYPSSR
jgi:hypothetical protein